jgi:hypothetical protein
MRFLRLISALLAVAGLTLAAAGVASSRPEAARFAVTLHGTASKQWTYSRTTKVGSCTTVVKATGMRTVTMRNADVALVTGSWSGGKARARFAGPIPVRGTIVQSGTKTTKVSGTSGCGVGTTRQTCARVTRSYSDKTTGLLSRRLHRLGITRVRDLVSSDFDTPCPGEPKNVRAVSATVELADASYSERSLFDRTTAGLSLQGGIAVTTTLGGGTGTVVQHASLSILLRHVG